MKMIYLEEIVLSIREFGITRIQRVLYHGGKRNSVKLSFDTVNSYVTGIKSNILEFNGKLRGRKGKVKSTYIYVQQVPGSRALGSDSN